MLCNALNRGVYYEERIAEEYPKVQVNKGSSTDTKSKLEDLFE